MSARRSILLYALLAGCVNEPPSPPLLHIEPVAPDTTADLVAVIDAESLDLEGDEATYAYSWSREGVSGNPIAGETLAASHTNRGERWMLTVIASDARGDAPPARVSVLIDNALPAVSSVLIDPAAPTSADSLHCSSAATDADGDALDQGIQWVVNGLPVGTAETLEPTAFASGDEVACTVRVTDGHGGSADGASTVTIGDTAPVVESVDLVPAIIRRGTDVSAVVTTSDLDGDVVSLTYAWTVNGVEVGSADVLDGDLFERDDVIGLVVTPDDGVLSGLPLEADSVVVANALPAIEGISLSPDSPEPTDTVTATAGAASDPDGDSVTVTYAWTVDGVLQAAMGTTFSSGSLTHGDVITVTATPHDGFGAGPAVSDSVTVDNRPPTVASATLTLTEITESSTVGCTAGATFDADGDTVAVRREWLVDGVVVSTATTLGGDKFDRGESVACRLTPNDGFEDGASVTSSAVVVSNSPPSEPVAEISPTRASVGDTLTCSLAASSSDLDGDTISYAYSWTLDGASLSTSSSVTTASGGTYECSVTASDGYVTTTPSTASVRIATFSYSGTIDGLADATIDGTSSFKVGRFLGSGDVDGDGTSDLLVPSSYTSLPSRVAVISSPLSSATTTVASASATLVCYSGSTACGGADWVDTIDIDGSGTDNIVIGAVANNYAITDGGGVWILDDAPTGSLSITPSTADLIYGSVRSGYLGWGGGNVGDVDGDGLDDLAFSDYGADAAYIVYGGALPAGASKAASVADVTLSGTAYGFGASFEGCDADGDGYRDLLLGATADASDAGAAYLFAGPVTSVSYTAAAASFSGSGTNQYGMYLACADLDGTASLDFVIAASSGTDVTVFLDPSAGAYTIGDADVTIASVTTTTSSFPWGLDTGDFDGDGLDDLFLGDINYSAAAPGGQGAIFFGGTLSGALAMTDADVWMSESTATDYLGDPGLFDDFDGDGLSDLAVSATFADYAGSDYGRVWLVGGR